jgi:N-acetylglucosamine transport system substrate-binding protein
MHNKEKPMNNRRLSQKFFILFAVLTLLSACASPASPTINPTSVPTELPPTTEPITEPTTEPTAEPTTELPEEVMLEVAIESAGYGLDLYQEIAQDFEALHPGVTVNLWGVPEIWNQLQPRFIAGDTPDLVAAIQLIDHAALMTEGQIMPLNDLLNSPAVGQPEKKFVDTVVSGMLEGGKRDGNYYLFPWNAVTYGIFYNEDMFAEHGWKIPQTWSELYDLCDNVEAEEIACIAFPGVWPEYFTLTSWWDLIERIGGREAQLNMENLEPGAWNSDVVIEANKLIQELPARGYFQADWEGQDHTVAQTLFVTGGAALNFNGTWLEAEMSSITPEDFRMGFFPTPSVQGGKGDGTNLRVGSDWFFIPSAAKNPELAGEFLKFIFSVDNARKFVGTTQSLSPIIGSTEGVDISYSLSTTMKAMEDASSVRPWYWQVNYFGFYDLLATEVMGELLRQEITPQEMADKLEALADEIRSDDSITKVRIED